MADERKRYAVVQALATAGNVSSARSFARSSLLALSIGVLVGVAHRIRARAS